MKTLRVLVPLDGSPLSEAVLPHIGRLDAPRVTLLGVVEEASLFGATPARREEELRQALARAKAALETLGLTDVAADLRRGAPAEVILETAGELEPGLLALATHGRGGLTAKPFGRVAGDVIHGSEFPVLAVRPDAAVDAAPGAAPTSLFARVLAPSDGSPLAWRAVEELELLGAAGKGRLTLLGVHEYYVEGHAAAAHHTPGEAVKDPLEGYLAQRCDDLRATLDREAKRARDLGFDVADDVDIGRPAQKILDRARADRSTLIAMATHGRTGISRIVLGSVTEAVLAGAPAPVLICR